MSYHIISYHVTSYPPDADDDDDTGNDTYYDTYYDTYDDKDKKLQHFYLLFCFNQNYSILYYTILYYSILYHSTFFNFLLFYNLLYPCGGSCCDVGSARLPVVALCRIECEPR